ncbi:MAG: hypothetical protein ACKOQM_13565 [Novosphingobium sp.]
MSMYFKNVQAGRWSLEFTSKSIVIASLFLATSVIGVQSAEARHRVRVVHHYHYVSGSSAPSSFASQPEHVNPWAKDEPADKGSSGSSILWWLLGALAVVGASWFGLNMLVGRARASSSLNYR